VRYICRMAKTVPLSHRLEPELKAELQRLADADRRSLTNYIEVVLEQHVAGQKIALLALNAEIERLRSDALLTIDAGPEKEE